MISFHWHVPAGDRDCKNWKGYWKGFWKGYRNNKYIPMGLVRVRFNHALDEMFYFEDEKDAEWFVTEGFQDMLLQKNGIVEDRVVSVEVVDTDVVETDVVETDVVAHFNDDNFDRIVARFNADNFDHIKF